MEERININPGELTKAISIYVSGESGISESVAPEEAGRRGAFVEDLAETGKKFVNGEITREQVEQEVIKKSVRYTVSKIIKKIADYSLEAIVKFVEANIPAVIPIVEAVKEPIKKFVIEKVANKVTEVATKTWNKIKTWAVNKIGG